MSDRPMADLGQDAMAGYRSEVAGVRNLLDGRCDDVKSSRTATVDGEAFFESLRQREDELFKGRPPK